VRTSRSRLKRYRRRRPCLVIVVVVGVADVVVPTSSRDVTKLKVDERFDKRVGSRAGRLKTLSRRANGLLCGPSSSSSSTTVGSMPVGV